jgi:large subunit ribosomal protein L6
MKYGTTRSLVANAVKGVFTGWTKVMELVGTGYRAEVKGNELILTVGFSHPVVIKAPEEIAFKVEKSEIIVESVDKETLGLVCSKIRSVRPPEPYKGKGIRYKDEVIRRKAGKAAKAAGA